MFVHIFVQHMYIYIYRERERARDREVYLGLDGNFSVGRGTVPWNQTFLGNDMARQHVVTYLYLYISLFIYVCI